MYNKINIVESKNPPTNKNDWWYNLNTGVLKRYTAGVWSSILSENEPLEPEPEVELPAIFAEDPSTLRIQLLDTSEDDDYILWLEGQSQLDDLKLSIDVQDAILDVKLPSDTVSSIPSNLIVESTEILLLVLPIETSEIETDAFKLSDIGVLYIGPNVETIGARAFSARDYAGIYVYAPIPPIIELDSFYSSESVPGNISVYVPAAYYDAYKNATNWCNMNLQKIE